MQSREDAHCGIAINLADIGACWQSKDDLLHAVSRQRLRSSPEMPNSARMSSWGMPSPGCCAIQAFEDGDGDPGHAVVARRGTTSWLLSVTGTPAHSSQIFSEPVGAGAVFEAARI